ncbi:MAG TPA: hypothetical protein VEU33_23335 [Archangium sp.]|nr:hypothetical protein [Archangium sp.]
MWNDDVQLDEELQWQPRKGSWKRTPRGATAIMAMGGVLMLPMWAITMQIVGSASDLAAVGVFLIMGLEGVVAMAIARGLWSVMGPIPRTLIRPLMLFGPLPPLALMCCFGAGLFGMKEPNPHFLSRGLNWAIPKNGDPVRFSEVQALCAKLGSQWRIPREGEMERLKPTPPLGMTPTYLANAAYKDYWLQPAPNASPAQDFFLRIFCMNKQCRPEVHREPKDRSGNGENMSAAICVDF